MQQLLLFYNKKLLKSQFSSSDKRKPVQKEQLFCYVDVKKKLLPWQYYEKCSKCPTLYQQRSSAQELLSVLPL